MSDPNKIIKIVSTILAGSALLYASKNMFLSRAENNKPAREMTIPALDFDDSMHIKRYASMLENPTMKNLYETFKQQYRQLHPSTIEPEPDVRIPKKIHQITLNSNGELSEEQKQFQKSWKKFHPEWEYKLWTEKDIPTFPFRNKDLFDAAASIEEKSDIWRYEILHNEGGLYVDLPVECLAPFDAFHHTYDSYVGIQPMDTGLIQLGNGIIGARQGHPLLRLAIVNLRNNLEKKHTSAKTGPIFYTRIFYNAAHATGLRDIALPTSYFYPCSYSQRSLAAHHWIKPESFAVYHWNQ